MTTKETLPDGSTITYAAVKKMVTTPDKISGGESAEAELDRKIKTLMQATGRSYSEAMSVVLKPRRRVEAPLGCPDLKATGGGDRVSIFDSAKEGARLMSELRQREDAGLRARLDKIAADIAANWQASDIESIEAVPAYLGSVSLGSLGGRDSVDFF